ncbi:MAG TPA: trypsin-like peptidase domain-containing protein [Gemmataceae bacterium]|nr:trypsin-like peptidase domain-containing protein [Gemmataceae bacterium]
MSIRFTHGVLPFLVAYLTLALGHPAPAQERLTRDPTFQKSSATVLKAFHAAVAKPSESTVRVQVAGKDAALGTIVGPDGWILTKASELKSKPVVCRLRDGRHWEARVVGIHEPYDLALLKIDAAGLPAVEWRNSKSAAVGTWIAAPGPEDVPIAVGVVSVAARTVTARDLPPSNRSATGYLGVELADPAEAGARITRVMPNSPADKAGLKVDDLFLTFAERMIPDADTLLDVLGHHKPGEVVAIRIKRGGEEVELKVTLDRRPGGGGRGGRGDFQNRMSGALSDRRNGFPTILQHDAAIRPSDCGGPLVDLDGKVVGINIARAGRTETYAAPTRDVLPLLYDLMSGKLAPKPSADTAARSLTPEEKVAEARAAVERAEAGKAAADKKLAEARAYLKKVEGEAKTAQQSVSK